MRDARIVVDDLTVEQTKADREVEQVKTRRERDRTRMDSGQITNPKDLERMQHELVSLERRITTLEDAELEVMEKLEEAQQLLDRPRHPRRGHRRPAGRAGRGARREARRDRRARSTRSSAARGPATEGMPDDLMALYERLREQKGIGAALLRARQCGGCNMTLDASELSRIRSAPADEVIRCEECQRILVRTDESGL